MAHSSPEVVIAPDVFRWLCGELGIYSGRHIKKNKRIRTDRQIMV